MIGLRAAIALGGLFALVAGGLVIDNRAYHRGAAAERERQREVVENLRATVARLSAVATAQVQEAAINAEKREAALKAAIKGIADERRKYYALNPANRCVALSPDRVRAAESGLRAIADSADASKSDQTNTAGD